jgi:thioredoxin-related protein
VTVLDVTNDSVRIFNDAGNRSFATHNGWIDIKVNETAISLSLEPVLNSTITTIEGTGQVVSVDSLQYTLDLNHPLAGETLLIFVRVESIDKPQSLEEDSITLGNMEFHTKFETSISLARDVGKPVFLYAHASWCGWCRRFEADVLGDEEVIRTLEANFINIAIDVDRQDEVARDFKISVTPTMIFLDENGIETERIRGYRDLKAFKNILKTSLPSFVEF